MKKMTREFVCNLSDIQLTKYRYDKASIQLAQQRKHDRACGYLLPFLFSNSFWLGSKDQMYQNFNILFNTLISFSSFNQLFYTFGTIYICELTNNYNCLL